jgi:Zn-dependent peptidase ImmA (M78 family)
MSDFKALAKKAILEADKIRRQLKINAVAPVSIYDVAGQLELDVYFRDVPSLDGMYSRNPGPAIILGNDRPIGRQSFSCAHELGHHVFGHGIGLDEIDSTDLGDKKRNPDEYLVDCFAGYFLMPKFAVLRAFQSRGLTPKAAAPSQFLGIANYFEVGYTTLINQMAYGYHDLQPDKAKELLKVTPKAIRTSALGKTVNSEVVFADQYWVDRAIDIRIGDYIVTPPGTIGEGKGVVKVGEDEGKVVFQGVKQSPTFRLVNEGLGWCQFVRVMPRLYSGLAMYRHMEEAEEYGN